MYNDLSTEELQGLLEHPEEIETACEYNCDKCINEEIKEIKLALYEKNISK